MLRRFVLFASLVGAAVEAASRGAFKIGQDEVANIQATLGMPRIERIVYPSASYIAVKFADFNLPPGDQVVVRSPDNSVAYAYTGKGRGDAGAFYATFIPGDEAVVEYLVNGSAANVSDPHQAPLGFQIAGFARGLQLRQVESICGLDETKPIKCYAQGASLALGLPLAYESSRPVARLLLDGTSLCTGWLVGSDGHLITNQHCITAASDAASVDIEFDAESKSCSDVCRTQLGCSGTVVATSATFITNSELFDYAIVKLPTRAPVDTYGYLQIRASGPVVNERIYIPQHPRGYAKRIAATVANGAVARITRTNVRNGGCDNTNAVLYMADTEGGSSGSPVLAARDNAVVALHHCGGCDNSAVDVRDIVADLQTKGVVIPNLLAQEVATPIPPTFTPPPTPSPPSTPPPPPPPPAGQCDGLDSTTCNAAFFCTWNAAGSRCLRWWN